MNQYSYSYFLTKIRLMWKHTHLDLPFAIKLWSSCLSRCAFFAHSNQCYLSVSISNTGSPSTPNRWHCCQKLQWKRCKFSVLPENYIHLARSHGIWGIIQIFFIFFSCFPHDNRFPSTAYRREGGKSFILRKWLAKKSQEALWGGIHNFVV